MCMYLKTNIKGSEKINRCSRYENINNRVEILKLKSIMKSQYFTVEKDQEK